MEDHFSSMNSSGLERIICVRTMDGHLVATMKLSNRLLTQFHELLTFLIHVLRRKHTTRSLMCVVVDLCRINVGISTDAHMHTRHRRIVDVSGL